jgi:hypothetical protein
LTAQNYVVNVADAFDLDLKFCEIECWLHDAKRSSPGDEVLVVVAASAHS